VALNAAATMRYNGFKNETQENDRENHSKGPHEMEQNINPVSRNSKPKEKGMYIHPSH